MQEFAQVIAPKSVEGEFSDLKRVNKGLYFEILGELQEMQEALDEGNQLRDFGLKKEYGLYQLKISTHRVLFQVVKNKIICLYLFKKPGQKTPKRYYDLASKRLTQFS